MDVKKIYFDMDGVLANFDNGVEELAGFHIVKQDVADKRKELLRVPLKRLNTCRAQAPARAPHSLRSGAEMSEKKISERLHGVFRSCEVAERTLSQMI